VLDSYCPHCREANLRGASRCARCGREIGASADGVISSGPRPWFKKRLVPIEVREHLRAPLQPISSQSSTDAVETAADVGKQIAGQIGSSSTSNRGMVVCEPGASSPTDFRARAATGSQVSAGEGQPTTVDSQGRQNSSSAPGSGSTRGAMPSSASPAPPPRITLFLDRTDATPQGESSTYRRSQRLRRLAVLLPMILAVISAIAVIRKWPL